MRSLTARSAAGARPGSSTTIFQLSSLPGRLLRRYVPPIFVLIALILVWAAYISIFRVPFYVFPTPMGVAQALTARGWAYLPDAWTTTQETVAGFGLALCVGLPLAVVMSWSRSFRNGLYPVLIGSQMVPIFALAAVITVIFVNNGLLPQIIIATLVCFFPIVVNGVDGFSRVDPDLINLLRASGASAWRTFRTVRLPAALPSLFSGSKLALTFAVAGAALGEWFGGQSGLGYLMRYQDDQLQVANTMATAVVLTLLGAILFAGVSIAEKIAIPWHSSEGEGLGDMWRAG